MSLKNNKELLDLIEQAMDRHIIDHVGELPGYDTETGEVENETVLHIWLEEQLGIERPTLTLSGEILASLISDSTFRLILTKASVKQIVDQHLKVIDEALGERIESAFTNGYNSPDLNRLLHDNIKRILTNEVDNYLRINSIEIQKMVQSVVDKKLESTISSVVHGRLERIKKRLIDAAELTLHEQ